MATHPIVLLVEPDPALRRLIRSELKDEGCVVVDRATGAEALAFAEIYPGPIDIAVTDLAHSEHNTLFAHALRALPTGSGAKVSCLPRLVDRSDLIQSVRQVLPTQLTTRAALDAQPEHGDGAVFWGAQRHATAQEMNLPTAASF